MRRCFILLGWLWASRLLAVEWMIYPYQVNRLSQEQFERFCQSEARYLGLQMMVRPGVPDQLTVKRIARAAACGKKVILQIWFGPGEPFSWERYNFPNMALDEKIAAEFFSRAIDPLLKSLGPENLHAVHLLEETGMQFGWDVDMPGRPERDDDGYENGNAYDNPANFLWTRSLSGPDVLTIRRYNELFRKETGLDMRYYPVWSEQEMAVYRKWVQQRMEAGAHLSFARYIHRKYPGLRVYAFNGGQALITQSQGLDGHFLDPYANTLWVYTALRDCRMVMRPEEELVAMVWGNREKPAHLRLAQMAAAYLAGADILSTFGDRELEEEKWLETVHTSVKPFLKLPRFQHQPPFLVLHGKSFGATLQHAYFWITGLAWFDTCPDWAEETVSLKPYQAILSWGLWHKDLLDWVKSGGTLLLVVPAARQLSTAGFSSVSARRERKTFLYRPDGWMRENLRLQENYPLDVDIFAKFQVPDGRQDEFIYLKQYGQGLIVVLTALCHVQPPWQYEESWENYRKLLTDLCRGALVYHGKENVARTCLVDPSQGDDYL
ncbi:MAG TPA: hypothetical protein PK644_00355, partial [bacterium]|nr:hypothetical protein [bacterium]